MLISDLPGRILAQPNTFCNAYSHTYYKTAQRRVL